jgi:CP family cyanate transporter-like MFS transporter
VTVATPARSALALLAALFVAALALRPQLVGVGPLLPEIGDDLGVSHAVAGLLATIPVLCMGLFAPAAAPLAGRTGVRAAVAACMAAAFGGWRGALAAFSLATFALCIGWLVLSRGEWTQRSAQRATRLPVGRPVVWVIVAVFGLQSLVFYGITSWLPDAFQEHGWSAEAAGALVAAFGFAALPGGLVVPWLADRGGSRRLWLGGSSAAIAVATFGLAALPAAGFAWAALAGAAIGAVFPLCVALCLDVSRDTAAAAATAALVFLGGYMFASIAPIGLGAVRDATGSFAASLWVLFATALALLGCCFPLTTSRLRPA